MLENNKIRFIITLLCLLSINIYADTIIIRDTIFLEIPIDHRQYRDTLISNNAKITVGIDYSGYQCSLDSVWCNYTYQPTIQQVKSNGRKYLKIGQTLYTYKRGNLYPIWLPNSIW